MTKLRAFPLIFEDESIEDMAEYVVLIVAILDILDAGAAIETPKSWGKHLRAAEKRLGVKIESLREHLATVTLI